MDKIKQNQIDRYLDNFSIFKDIPTPKQGWVKYIRNGLGMTAKQLAKRAGITARRVSKIEEAELQDATTLKTLRHVAQAMNCKLVYAIIPETSINQIIEDQARKFVKQHLNEVSHHMALELQSVKDQRALEIQIEELVQLYLSKSLKIIWDE